MAADANTNIKLFVGLGNPDKQYALTRHNVGAWFVEEIAKTCSAKLRLEEKFNGFFAEAKSEHHSFKLLIPTTYMNCSGRAVSAVSKFYKIPPANILIVHDELDFSPGIAKLKFGGGHNGHNGVKDIIGALQNKDFYRLRIGIGKPNNISPQNQTGAQKNTADYVLENPSRDDREKIFSAIEKCINIVPQLLAGEIEQAMLILHSAE